MRVVFFKQAFVLADILQIKKYLKNKKLDYAILNTCRYHVGQLQVPHIFI